MRFFVAIVIVMETKRGRPPKDETERKSAELRIRLTTDERQLLDVAAVASDGTSTWARGILLREAKKKARRSESGGIEPE